MLYCLLKLDSINGLCTAFSIITGIALFVALVVFSIRYFVEDETDTPGIIKTSFKWLCITFCVTTLGTTFIPTTKEAVIMYGVPYMINKSSELNLDKVPKKLVDYTNAYLDQEITKLTTSNKRQEKGENK